MFNLFHYYRRYAFESTTIFVWKIVYYLHNVCFTDFFKYQRYLIWLFKVSCICFISSIVNSFILIRTNVCK